MNDNTDEPLVENKRSTRSLFRRVGLIAAVVVTILLVAVAGITAGIYKLGWENAVAQFVANTLPLPAGKAGNTVISASKYFERVNLLKIQQPTASPENIRKAAFKQLADEEFTSLYAQANKLTADPKSVERFIKAQNKYGTEGLDPEQLQRQAEGAVLSAQIAQDLARGQASNQVALAQAKKEIAALSSKDGKKVTSISNNALDAPANIPSAADDVGLVPLVLLPVEAQTTFLAMSPGQVTEYPIVVPQGLLVGKYVKNDQAGQPLIQFVIIQPTIEQWLEYKNISGSRRAYLPQAK